MPHNPSWANPSAGAPTAGTSTRRTAGSERFPTATVSIDPVNPVNGTSTQQSGQAPHRSSSSSSDHRSSSSRSHHPSSSMRRSGSSTSQRNGGSSSAHRSSGEHNSAHRSSGGSRDREQQQASEREAHRLRQLDREQAAKCEEERRAREAEADQQVRQMLERESADKERRLAADEVEARRLQREGAAAETPSKFPVPNKHLGHASPRAHQKPRPFSYAEVEKAGNGFIEANRIGEGVLHLHTRVTIRDSLPLSITKILSFHLFPCISHSAKSNQVTRHCSVAGALVPR